MNTSLKFGHPSLAAVAEAIEEQPSVVEAVGRDDSIRRLRSLPESIVTLSDLVRREFGTTADRCREAAATLRARASDLDERANKLDQAAPQITDEVQNWVAYETDTRESMAKLQFLLSK